MAKGIRAFSDTRYDYYELQESLEYLLPKGAVFVHDTDDQENGSISQGCLKLCWTETGNCYGQICGGTVILHAEYRNSKLFKKVFNKTKIDTTVKQNNQPLETIQMVCGKYYDLTVFENADSVGFHPKNLQNYNLKKYSNVKLIDINGLGIGQAHFVDDNGAYIILPWCLIATMTPSKI